MVSSIGSNSMASMANVSRHDPSRMASTVFSKLDTKGQGYIEASDLQSALSQLNSASSTSTESDSAALFKALDGNSDGKVTESEFSSSMQKLADALDSQAFSSRMAGAMPPPPPRPSGGDDAGFTQDELNSQLEEIGSTDSTRSALISKVAENFEAADTNGDGKVSASEAMAYEQKTATASSGDSSTGSTASSSDTRNTEAVLAQRLMELMRAYGDDGESGRKASVAVTA